ncbi:acylneuraminate cytidylyltransferase family protein [Kiloniella majae]|uniref:acylneuraminate cytidylyltransferase family protein n=1 Tax=Kiloniella majae TaxID=1938558 RepID=UPI000A277EF7|nr:acylneuraminate cytidylyltransferase family protein [Kiloniella majae]
MTKRLAIIPARGGSKRIPDKNIRNFCGKPMIAHILDTAKNSALFYKIHVSTDSAVIAEVCEDYGCKPNFMRSPDLSDDMAPLMPVLKDTLQVFQSKGELFDEVWLLMACSPLLEIDDLRDAASLFGKAVEEALIAVTPYPAPTEWAFLRNEEGHLTPEQPGMFATRSQDLAEKYYDSGAYAVFTPSYILNSDGAGCDSNFIGAVLPREKAIDIDTLDDWNHAEIIYKAKMLVE